MLIPSVILLVFSIFRQLKPYTHRIDLNNELLEKNNGRYEKIEKSTFFALLFSWLLIGLSVFIVGTELPNLILNSSHETYFYTADKLWWLWPAILLSIGLTPFPVELIYRLILRNEYDYYLEYTNRKHGWDGEKIMKPILRGITFLGLLISYLIFNTYTRIENSKIEINDFMSIKAKIYNYDDIIAINYYTNKKNSKGEINDFPRYEVVFLDDEIIDSKYDLAPIDNYGVQKIINSSGVTPIVFTIKE